LEPFVQIVPLTGWPGGWIAAGPCIAVEAIRDLAGLSRPRTGGRDSGGLDRMDALHAAGLQPFGFDDPESGGPDER